MHNVNIFEFNVLPLKPLVLLAYLPYMFTQLPMHYVLALRHPCLLLHGLHVHLLHLLELDLLRVEFLVQGGFLTLQEGEALVLGFEGALQGGHLQTDTRGLKF